MNLEKKTYLGDIVFLRLILILMLVLHHSFAPFSDAWSAYPGMSGSTIYKAIASVSRQLMMPVFVFISGYLYGYSVLKRPGILTVRNSVFRKFKRLILPSIVFSAIYYILFYDFDRSALHAAAYITVGCGHMWFLPMLFGCFVTCFIMVRLRINRVLVIVISLIIAVYPLLGLTGIFQEEIILTLFSALKATTAYFIYFYLGYLGGHMEMSSIMKRIATGRSLVCALIIFFVLKTVLTLHGTGCTFIHIFVRNILILGCGISAIALLYGIVARFLVGRLPLTPFLIRLSSYCFGVYIYQQFILMVLYYDTPLPKLLVEPLVPWLMFGITLALSIGFTRLTLRTRIGRYLIG